MNIFEIAAHGVLEAYTAEIVHGTLTYRRWGDWWASHDFHLQKWASIAAA